LELRENPSTASNDNVGYDQPLRLADAVRLCFPEGEIPESGLLRGARKGKLVLEQIAKRNFTTRRDIDEMRKLCRAEAGDHGFSVVDDCTRECLALVADTSLSGTRVARELDRLMIERGKPTMVVSDKRQRADQQRHPDMG
jgi:hypothetical protein